MTDRDTFAAAALTGILARGAWVSSECATEAYLYADAMIRKRGDTEPTPKEKRAEVSYTNHDAAPAARADSTDDRTDKAAPSPCRDGTGNISEAEIDAIQHVVEDGRFVDLGDYGRLRSLLVRLRPEWEDEESDRSKPISDERLAALDELSALDQKLELEYGLTGNPLIKAQQHMRSKNCCYCEKPHGKSSPLIFQSCDACQDERDKRAIDSSNSLTDEERQAIQWAATVSEGLCQMGAKDRAAALRGLLERMGGVQ